MRAILVFLFLLDILPNSFCFRTRRICGLNLRSLHLFGGSESEGEIKDVGVVLLAGGKGTRMKAAMPKQFLPLLGKPVFLRSLDIFQEMSQVSHIAVVLDKIYRDDYEDVFSQDSRLCWADPGVERQGSVQNGIAAIPDTCSMVAVHDAERPLVTHKEVLDVLRDAQTFGAAVLGVPMKATCKESEDGQFVLRTVDRSRLWEVHTPQVSTKKLFLEGFEKVENEGLEVTDDVSVIEALGKPVKITVGEYTNIKLTTPDDILTAEQIIKDRADAADQKPFPGLDLDDPSRSYPCR